MAHGAAATKTGSGNRGTLAGDNGESTAKLRVFVSYARADLAFADALVAALEQREIEVLIDRRDLPYGEEWKPEILGFVRRSEAVVFVVSPRSIASHWCKWEVAQVKTGSKRLVPIELEPVAHQDLPPEIGDIHLLPFADTWDPARGTCDSFIARASKLADVLLTDRSWIKEHSRIGERAQRWKSQQRNDDLLLGRSEWSSVISWAERRPKTAPTLSNLQIEYIMASLFGARHPIDWRNPVVQVSLATGTLSLVSLVRHGFQLGDFIAPIQVLLDGYQHLIHLIIGSWADPILMYLVAIARSVLSLDIVFDPDWKHVFLWLLDVLSGCAQGC